MGFQEQGHRAALSFDREWDCEWLSIVMIEITSLLIPMYRVVVGVYRLSKMTHT